MVSTRFLRSWGSSAALAAVFSGIGPVAAQQAPGPESPPQDSGSRAAEPSAGEVVVTGTRVRGVAPVGSTVIALGRQEIDASPNVTVDRMIREIPQVFDLGVSENSRGQSGGAGNIVYGNTVNIRGIGPYATLVLVDGHRVVNNTRSVDPSVLPTLGVERIEVLADGGSAIYGSDAIAGVANIIPRRSLDGGEVMARYGASEDGEFDEWQAGAAYGKRWSSGQAMLAYEHVFRANLSGDERDFFTSDQRPFGGPDRRVTRCSPGTIRVGSSTFAIPAAGVTPASAGALASGTTNLCEEFAGQDLFPEQEYDSVNATFTQELTDWLTLFGDGFWSKREFVREPAAAALNRQPVPGTNAFFVTPPGVTVPVCPATVAGVPAGTRCLTIDYSFLGDLPLNTQTGFARSWQVTPGLRADLPRDWQLEVLFGYGRTKDISRSTRGINASAVAAALRSSDPATALDVFGLHRTTPETLAALSNFISISPTLSRFKGYEARLSGTLFSLPGGEVKLATGYEGQQIDASFGDARGVPSTPLRYRDFDRQVDSAYGQIVIPLFGSANARTGLARLDIDAAIRYDDYSDVGSTTNPKFGINWSPMEGLKFRGNWGTSFRAPLLTQIYGNSNNLFVQSYQDPQAGGATVQGVARSGGNLQLAPEEATTWAAGVDWDPLQDLRLSLTYWNVDYDKQVNAVLSDLTVLRSEADYAGTGIITRGAAAGALTCDLLAQGIALSSGTFPGGSCQNVTLFVDGRNFNLGRSITRGIDFQTIYRLRTQALGLFTFDVSGSYITKYELGVTPRSLLRDRLDFIFNPLRFKGRASVTWDIEPFRMQLTATHVSGYTNDIAPAPQKVDSYTPVDLGASWNIGGPGASMFAGGFQLGVEVRNLFDTEPPYVNIAPGANGGGGYDPSTTNPIGRQFNVVVRARF